MTDACATVAVAYNRAAGVYVGDEKLQELGTAASSRPPFIHNLKFFSTTPPIETIQTPDLPFLFNY